MAVFGQNALRVELHTVHRTILVVQRHDFAIISIGIRHQAVRKVRRVHGEGMVANNLIALRQALKQAPLGGPDLGELTVAYLPGLNDSAAIGLANCLMAETHTEDGEGFGCRAKQAEADTCFIRRAGAW